MDTASTLLDFIHQNQPDAAAAHLTANPDAARERGADGESPILAAIYRGQADLARQIASIAAPDLCEAAALGDADAVRSLLDCGATHTTRSWDGWTALHLAAFLGSVPAMQLLVANGADLEALSTNSTANTPLCAALAGTGSLDLVRELISAGANVNTHGAHGVTPLHLAASRGADDTVRLLLDHGARKDATMDDGTSPAVMAEARGHASTAELLR